MTESFQELFEESLKSIEMKSGSIVTGTVVDIDKDWITVHAGLKSEGTIPADQFLNDKGEIEVAVGDEVRVSLEAVEDGFGATRLSREKAKRAEVWLELEEANKSNETVIGVITGKVKGGFTVELRGLRAFLPGSLVDVRPLREISHLENIDLEFKVIKLDTKRNNVVVSRRAVMESANSTDRDALLETLEEGNSVKGVIKNLTDYGAFVDLGGVDGLLHITDMSWKRIKHPSEMINIGDEIDVKVLKFDRERNRVSLGMKQMGDDPWGDIKGRYPVGKKTKARITNLTDYGCFAELEDGVEGLVHVSEMDWTNKNVHPSKIVDLGQEVDVMILEIDEERRRISLGIKQCFSNPWSDFAAKKNKGDKVSGTIKSITDFGIFIGLEGGIDGLVHLSDISWHDNGEESVRNYKKGDEVETSILSIDSERERISLGIKQLSDDPFMGYVMGNEKGSIVKGKVINVDEKMATISLSENVEATLKASEFSRDSVSDLKSKLKLDDEVEAKIINVDKKNRTISLSIKAKDLSEEKEAVKAHKSSESESQDSGAATIGDLIKAQMDK
ncbi:MAG: 30S ribosomal protein S1 [Pseudomonadota bacterium]|nr:30S ribosomal protein S1 [Pseudomonadales bacterium]MEC7636974.1 30S ribosomal protein S1 [Pseudomonadota bacterium]